MLARILRSYCDAFSGLPRTVWTLAGLALVNRAGTMVFPFLSLYLTRQLGFSSESAALVMLAFGAGSIVGSYGGGWFATRIGSIRVQQLSLLSSGLAFLALPWLDSVTSLSAGTFIVSTLGDSFRPAVMSAVSELSPRGLAPRGFALMRLAVNLGMAIGPAAGGWLALYNYDYLFFVDGGSCIAAGALTWLALGKHEASRAPIVSRKVSRAAWRDLPFLAFIGLIFLFAIAFFQIFCTLPLYFHDRYGFDESAIGGLLAFNATIIVVFEMLLVKTFEKRNPLHLFAGGSILVGLGLAILPFGSSVGFAALSIVVWSVGEMLSLPFANAIVATRAGHHGSGEYMGLYTVAFSCAFMAAPAIGLSVYGHFGGQLLCFGIGGIGLLVAALLALMPRHFLRAADATTAPDSEH